MKYLTCVLGRDGDDWLEALYVGLSGAALDIDFEGGLGFPENPDCTGRADVSVGLALLCESESLSLKWIWNDFNNYAPYKFFLFQSTY